MADIQIASFDIDARAAIQQVLSLQSNIQKLEAELNTLQKEGKDTAAVQAQLAAATSSLNKTLAQETVTMKGAAAQTQALTNVTKQSTAATNQSVQSQGKLDAASKKSANSMLTLVGRSKNLGQALARGSGALTNLVGGFGLTGAAIGTVTELLSGFVSKLFEASAAQKAVDEATRDYTEQVGRETSALNIQFKTLTDSNSTYFQRKDALDSLITQFPEYFGGLTLENATIGQLNEAYSLSNSLIKQRAANAVINAKTGEQESIILEQQIKFSRELSKFKAILIKNGEDEAVAEAALAKIRAGAFSQVKFSPQIAGLNEVAVAVTGLRVAYSNTQQAIKAAKAAQDELNNIKKDFGPTPEEQAALEKKRTEIEEKARAERNAKAREAGEAGFKADNERIKKAQDERNRIAAAANKKIADERKRIADGISQLNDQNAAELERKFAEIANSTDPVKGSLAALRSALSEIDKQLNEGVKANDFVRIRELQIESENLKAEIESLENAIASLGKRPVELNLEKDFSTFEKAVETAKLSLGQLRADQAQANLDRARDEAGQLARVSGNAKAEAALREKFAADAEIVKRKQLLETLAIQEDIAKAELRLANETGEIFGQASVEAQAELLDIQRQIVELSAGDYEADIKIKLDEASAAEAEEKLKERVNQIADFIGNLSGQVTDFLKAQNQQAIDSLDSAIDTQKSKLDELLSNADTVNVELVRLEQERLDNLNKARKKAADREAIIAQAQIAVNLALAVARAVAEGGGIASALTVSAAIAAAVFGFISAKQAAANAYYKGTTYVDDSSAPNGIDTVNAKLTKGEAVITRDKNKAYKSTVEAVHYGLIPADVMNAFVASYTSGHVSDNLDFAPTGSPTVAIKKQLEAVQIEFSQSQFGARESGSELSRIASAISQTIKEMPRMILRGKELVTVVRSEQDKISKIRNKAKGAK